MKTILLTTTMAIAIVVFLLSLLLFSALSRGAHASSAITCFKTGEVTSGLNKICYYDCAGSAAAITVKGASLCPLSIER